MIFKDVLEKKAGMKVDGNMAITPWIIRWAAMNISRFQVGTDGMTPYERRRGKRCKIPVVCFGEKIWYKKRDKPKDRNKSDPGWEKPYGLDMPAIRMNRSWVHLKEHSKLMQSRGLQKPKDGTQR